MSIVGTNLGSGTDITEVVLCGGAPLVTFAAQSATQVVVSAPSHAVGACVITVVSTSHGSTVYTPFSYHLGTCLRPAVRANLVLTAARPSGRSGHRLGRTHPRSDGAPIDLSGDRTGCVAVQCGRCHYGSVWHHGHDHREPNHFGGDCSCARCHDRWRVCGVGVIADLRHDDVRNALVHGPSLYVVVFSAIGKAGGRMP